MSLLKEPIKIEHWISTINGRAFDFVDLANNTFDPEEVATVLARIPRFAGHSRWFYSVAQHSVLVSQYTSSFKMSRTLLDVRLVALLHDVSEAFIGDITGPLKYLLRVNDNVYLHNLEERIWRWIAKHHQLDPKLIDSIKEVDLEALTTEYRDLMPNPPLPLMALPSPWLAQITPWSIEYARDAWLEAYQTLMDYRSRIATISERSQDT